MKKIFFLICLCGISSLVQAEEKSGFELPDVTILGQDVSEFEVPGPYTQQILEGRKGKVQFLESPEWPQTQERTMVRSLAVTAGRYGTVTSGLDWVGREKNLDYLVQMKYARTDGYRDHGSEDLIRPAGSVGVQVNDRIRLEGDYSFFRKRMELPGRIDHPTNFATRENQVIDFETGLELYPMPDQKIKSSFFGTDSRTHEDPLNESFDDRFLGFSTGLSDHALVGGVDFWTEKLQNFYSYQKVAGYFGVSGMEVREDIILDLLSAVDYYEGMAVRLDPKSSITWYFADRWSLETSVKRDMQVRSWSESYLSEYYVEGNLDELRPQRSLEGQIAISYEWLPDAVVSLSVFRKEAKDLFIWQDLDKTGLYTLGNHPEGLIQGGALEWKMKFLNAVTNRSSVQFQELEGSGSSPDIPYYPQIKLNWSLEWQFDFGLGLGTEISYIGSQSADVQGPEEINDYVLWDVMASYRWKRATFFAKVLNVLDQRYDFFAGYPGPDTQYQFGINVEF